MICPRCGKPDPGVHTCNPTAEWRAAYIAGMERAAEMLEDFEYIDVVAHCIKTLRAEAAREKGEGA